jgi:hypothetical protein
MKKIRIFIGFSEVANVFSNLLKGFRGLGVQYTFIVYGENPNKYEGDNSKNIFQEYFYYLNERMIAHKKSRIISNFFYLIHVLLRVPLFIWALSRHDVFVFSYNSSFFGLYDLPILKFFNKKIIYYYFGSDGRPPYLNGNYISEEYNLSDVYNLSLDKYKKLKWIEKYSTYIISDLNYSQFFSTKIIDLLQIGIPINLEHIETNEEMVRGGMINILHAPSSKKAKGSKIFSEIIEELKNEGHNINYIELSNVPNRIVLEGLIKCDFLVDELYSDAPMAGLATEAAYFAKPAIIGGYASFDSRKGVTPPSLYVEPSKIKQAIVKLIVDKRFRIELGEKAKKYVAKYRTPEVVTNKFLQIVNDDIPDEWFFDAPKSDYFYGWAVSKENLKFFLKNYIEKYGKEGLFLSHNSNLENKILDFIRD